MSDVTFKDNSNIIKSEFNKKSETVLEAVGLQAQGNAISEITSMGAVDTGRLRNSITWITSETQGNANTWPGDSAMSADYSPLGSVQNTEVYIGTNVEYAPYIELGTYKMSARPFLKNAVANHAKEYKRIIQDGLK